MIFFTKNEKIADYSLHSRIHALKFLETNHLKMFVKREDELSCTISGSKIRKYVSLIPDLLAQSITHVGLIGGHHSNHVLGLSQLLIENNITPILFTLKNHTNKKGNALLINCLISENNRIEIARNQWDQAEEIALDYFSKTAFNYRIVPEGAFMNEALPGALTLTEDILRNEQQAGLKFDHIFIDSGMGLSAIALILGLKTLRHSAHVHVISMSDHLSLFHQKLKKMHEVFLKMYNLSLDVPFDYSFYQPDENKSFGSTSSSIFSQIKEIARSDGFFCDPIYNAKLFIKAKSIIIEKKLEGIGLIIQSGGTFSLMGFDDKL